MLHLETILLVWIAFGAFQATTGAKFPEPASPCFPETQCTPGQVFPPPEFQPDCPSKFTYEKSSPQDPCIDNFVSTFTQAIRSSQALTELYGFFSHIGANEFVNGKYQEIKQAFYDLGAPIPEFIAQQTIEAITESFDTLTSDIVIQVYANSIAKYLLSQGVLTPQSAVQLGKQYAHTMEKAANSKYSPNTALTEGSLNFLDSFGLIRPDTVPLIAHQYANEWKLAAKPRRR